MLHKASPVASLELSQDSFSRAERLMAAHISANVTFGMPSPPANGVFLAIPYNNILYYGFNLDATCIHIYIPFHY